MDEISASWSTEVLSDRPPTTSSKLIALGALQGIELGERATRVWYGLSRAVHHHAYELQPSVAEVRQLVRQVRTLSSASGVMTFKQISPNENVVIVGSSGGDL